MVVMILVGGDHLSTDNFCRLVRTGKEFHLLNRVAPYRA